MSSLSGTAVGTVPIGTEAEDDSEARGKRSEGKAMFLCTKESGWQWCSGGGGGSGGGGVDFPVRGSMDWPWLQP